MNPNENSAAKSVSRNEWLTLGIGALLIIIIIILMIYTGSPAEPKNTPTATTPAAGSSSKTVAAAGDTVTVNYTGKLADGTVFDSTAKHNNQPFSFVLGAGQVIPGWDKGVVGMKVGDTKTLVIPPADAYGARGVPNPTGSGYIIPPNATLTFDVQLLSVEAPVGQ